MTSDLDIWRAAVLLIQHHGGRAEFQAAKRHAGGYACTDALGANVCPRMVSKTAAL
jgi:hypothetical protein